MTNTLVQAIAGLAILYLGGGLLVRGASELAARLGVPPLAIGLTVVAFGTSAPELVVSLNAALAGAGDISVGNVVGSNIANIGLILGLAALARPLVVQAKAVRIDAPLMIVVAMLLVAVMADSLVSRAEGGVLLIGLGAYALFTLWEARQVSEPMRAAFAPPAPSGRAAVPVSLLRIAGGLVSLVVGGSLLVTSAVALAGLLGVDQATIGLTVVAVGTSLPELSTSLVASLRGQGDIAIGNVVGSNIFNVLGILGVTALVDPPTAGAITSVDLGAMVVFSVVLAALLSTRLRLERLEGAVLIVSYLVYAGRLFTT